MGSNPQKHQVMMAGSISKKLKGLNIKNRAWIEILLHYIGVRVYFSKTQGAFCKTADVTAPGFL